MLLWCFYVIANVLLCQELQLCSVLCEFMYFYFDFLFSTVSHFRFPNVYPLHLLSILFSVFKPCPSLVKLTDCSSLLPSQCCCYLSVYHCLLRSRPSFAFEYSLSPSDFVPLLIGLFVWFDLPACHWPCCLSVESVILPGTFSKTCFCHTARVCVWVIACTWHAKVFARWLWRCC